MMNSSALDSALATATEASLAAGQIIRAHHRSPKKAHHVSRHDIKLELDVRCQRRIETILQSAFPSIPILGEEGDCGEVEGAYRWVVDPIDGTVNFAYGIPHCCTAVALQERRPSDAATPPAYQTVLGVVYDPFCEELFSTRRGRAVRLNGGKIRASSRSRLAESLVGIGFAKETATLERMQPVWQDLLHRVRKVRIMGAAALGLAYVAAGRLDAYVEYGLRLWDVAAAGLMIENAGGHFWHAPLSDRPHSFHIIASNAPLRRLMARYR